MAKSKKPAMKKKKNIHPRKVSEHSAPYEFTKSYAGKRKAIDSLAGALAYAKKRKAQLNA